MNRTTAVALGLVVFGAAGLGASFAAAPAARTSPAVADSRKPYVLALSLRATDKTLACRRAWHVSSVSLGHLCRRNDKTPAKVAEVSR